MGLQSQVARVMCVKAHTHVVSRIRNPGLQTQLLFQLRKIFFCLYCNISSVFLALFSPYVITIIYRWTPRCILQIYLFDILHILWFGSIFKWWLLIHNLLSAEKIWFYLFQCVFNFCYTHLFISFCYSVAKSCPTLWDPTYCNMPGFPVLHYLPEFPQIHVRWISDAIQPSHPLLPSSFAFYLCIYVCS